MGAKLWWWVGRSVAACLLAGCSGEGFEDVEEGGELQQAVDIQSACEGVTAQPPPAGRYNVLKVKAGTDTTISKASPDTNFQNALRCYTSFDAQQVCLMRFPIELPETAQIHFAQLTVRIETAFPARYFAYTMDTRWTEAGATWNSYKTGSPWAMPGARSDIRDRFCTFTSGVARMTYNLSGSAVSQIQDWVSGRAENSGIGFFADVTSSGGRLNMFASEGLPENAPELTLWYTDKPVASQTVTLSAVASTTIDKTNADVNFSNMPACEVSRAVPSGERACLLRWNTSSIPSGSLVTRVVPSFGTAPTPVRRWDLYPLRRPWVENQATWNVFATGSNWQKPGAWGSSDAGSSVGYLVPALTGPTLQVGASGYGLVQSWVDDPQTNQGALFSPSRQQLASTPAFTLTAAPTLRVTFTPP